MTRRRALVIYHGHCPDGFTAAWVAARALRDVELFSGKYGEPPPLELATDRDVYVVDFSYPLHEMLELARIASFLVVLDHHKTAAEALSGHGGLESMVIDTPAEETVLVEFDMDRSGAGITWDYFHRAWKGEPRRRPWIVDYVQDRDLWRFALPHSKAVSLWIRTSGYTLEAWDEMAAMKLEDVLEQAQGCARYLLHYVEDALQNAYPVTFSYQIPDPHGAPADLMWTEEPAIAVNATREGVSDVLHAALERHGVRVAVGWHITAAGDIRCDLRSVKDFDCSVIARHLGGGGHAQASGFRMRRDCTNARALIQQEGPIR